LRRNSLQEGGHDRGLSLDPIQGEGVFMWYEFDDKFFSIRKL